MTTSEQVNEIAAALAKAQGAIQAATRSAENPHFRSKYADLGAVWDACRDALSRQGLAVVQSPRLVTTHESIWFVEVDTLLLHASGQWLRDVLAMPLQAPTAQGVGSAVTYARRYALAAIVGVAPADDDDDGNAATAPAADAPPPGALETTTVRVLGIVKRTLPSGQVKFVISASDQHTYGTFKFEQATAAKDAQEAGKPIAITYKTSKYGRDIVALTVDDTEPPL